MTSTALPLLRSRLLLGRASDERLVEQLRTGNERAFEVLFDRHHRALLSFCRHLLGSQEEAEDAVQQTFISAHRQLCAPDRRIHHLKPWLFKIARNRCISILRSRREEPSEDLPESVSVSGLSEQVEEREDVRQLLRDLSEVPVEQRAALLLAETGALSHEQVCRALGCEETKVKSLVYQARTHLIERRNARGTPCQEFREQIALGGAALRRGAVRRHVKACPDCRAYQEQVRGQRALMALALPVTPSAGFRESVLAAAGIGGGGGTAGGLGIGAAGKAATAGGGAAAGGSGGGLVGGAGLVGGSATGGGLGATAFAGVLGAVKVAAVAAAATGAAIGGTAVVKDTYQRVTGEEESRTDSRGDAGGEAPKGERGASKQDPGQGTGPRSRGQAAERPGQGASGTNGQREHGRGAAGGQPVSPERGGRSESSADSNGGHSRRPSEAGTKPRGEAGAQPRGNSRDPSASPDLELPKPPRSVPETPSGPEAPSRPDEAPPLPESPDPRDDRDVPDSKDQGPDKPKLP